MNVYVDKTEHIFLDTESRAATRLWRCVAPVAVDVTASDALQLTSV